MRATSAVRALVPTRRAHLPGALGAVLCLVSVALTAQGRVLLHQCVVADGPLAVLGVRLSVLRSAVECPEGTFGVGTAAQGAVVLLSVAVPVLLAHVLLAACGLGLGAAVRHGVRAVASLAARLVAVPGPAAAPLPAGGPQALAGDVAVLVRRDLGHDPARPRRGPPTS